MSLKSFVFDGEKCDLCRKCEEACLQCLRELDQDYVFSPIRVVVSNGKPFLSVCRQCEDAPCVEVCIAGAMQQGEGEEFVLHNPGRCIGCLMCNMVCPWGVVTPLYSRKNAFKCSGMCNTQNPPCVCACDRDALIFEAPLKTVRKRRVARGKVIPVEKLRP
jgi:carbon-monoxide dehydrogenase iron sulfur subunit